MVRSIAVCSSYVSADVEGIGKWCRADSEAGRTYPGGGALLGMLHCHLQYPACVLGVVASGRQVRHLRGVARDRHGERATAPSRLTQPKRSVDFCTP